MPTWDVFHSERLEVERGLTTAEVRAALARGEIRDDDLARPAGSTIPWARLADLPGLLDGPEAEDEPEPEAAPTLTALVDEDSAESPPIEDDEPVVRFGPLVDEFDSLEVPLPPPIAGPSVRPAEPVPELKFGPEEFEPYDPQDEDEEAVEFSLAPRAARGMEELDLTAMVDVAFQLILFFLVTATSMYFKTLEVPRPNPERPEAAAQTLRTLEDLQDDYILVGIDPGGAITVDHEPAPADPDALTARLREARERTGRTAMLLTADFATPHRNAVLAYDAANGIGLRIAIARPTAP